MAAGCSRSFEQEWPDLARKLQSLLSSKRVPASKREDIVQETGLRLFRMWDDVDPERPVWALTVTIALNLVRDDARRRSTSEVLGAIPDIPSSYDVERSGIARLELARVERALSQMTPAHRSVLLAELGDEVSLGRGANAVKMLRMRARRRLTSLLDSASASLVFTGVRLRKYLRVEHAPLALRGPADQGQSFAHTAAGVAAAVAMFSLLPQTVTPPSAHAQPPRVVEERMDVALTLPDGAVEALLDHSVRPATIAVRTRGKLAARPDLRGRARALKERSRHVRIGMGDDYIEGSAEVGAFGIGAQVHDREEEPPACLSGLPLDPHSQIKCEDSAAQSNHDGSSAGASVEARAKVGHREVELRIEV